MFQTVVMLPWTVTPGPGSWGLCATERRHTVFANKEGLE